MVALEYSVAEAKSRNLFSSSSLTVGRCVSIACRKSSTETCRGRTYETTHQIHNTHSLYS